MSKKTSKQNQRSTSGVVASDSFAAAAYASGQKVKEPRISGNGQSTRIRHRELLATVTGTTSFGVFGSYVLNPGLSATFPWLSTQATSWEQYRFHALRFEYVTRTATTAIGSVVLAPDYDSLDTPPSTELIATSYRDSSEDAPWKDQCSHLDPTAMHPLGPRKYIRTGGVPLSDLKTYDAGVMHVCTTSQANTDAIGKLFVEYDVELAVPQTESAGTPVARTLAAFNLSADQGLSTGAAATIVFDETLTNTLGITNSSGVFTLPLGAWEIFAECSFGGATSTTVTALLEIEKNGAALPMRCLATTSLVATMTARNPNLGIHGFVTSVGTDSIRIRATYTSAAGTLVAFGDYTRVFIRAV